MDKLPTKQIYLLIVIIVGIIALSIYSTYAIFTIEGTTSDIVSINTPGSLNLDTDAEEYRQVTIPKDSFISTDVDIYNNFDYEICYSIWYKIIDNEQVSSSKVKVLESTTEAINSTGTLSPIDKRRISLFIVNDNDTDAKVKIGLSYSKNTGTCELNLANDRKSISETIGEYNNLVSHAISTTPVANNAAGYLTYKNINKNITLNENVYVADDFTYDAEIFTLKEPKEIEVSSIGEYQNKYLCLEDNSCKNIYRIIKTDIINEKYNLTEYDKLVGYLAGDSGLRQINNNYVYYGDNPKNFIYYNCQNEKDLNTCELWRIIGYYHTEDNNYVTKIIKDDYLTKTKYSNNSIFWSDSNLDNYLDKEYKIDKNYLKLMTFSQENVTDLEINQYDIAKYENKYNSYVSIPDLSDYLNASLCKDKKISEFDSDCLNNNWLNIGDMTWTKTIKHMENYVDSETNEEVVPNNNTVYAVGNTISDININEELYVRPVIYLKARTITTGGTGTLEEPFIIK